MRFNLTCEPIMGLFRKDLFKAIAAAFAAFLALPMVAYGQSATSTQFSDPYGSIAAHADGTASKAPKPVKPAARETSKSKIAAKKQPVTAGALGTATSTLADPLATPTAPVAPSLSTNVPAKDNALGLGLKWYGANAPSYNASSSTIPATDQLKRDSNDLLGDPSSTGSGVEAGVNLKF